MQEKNNSILQITDYELFVNIGVEEGERKNKQRILLSIKIFFKTIPKAVITDRITDTKCYLNLCNKLDIFNNQEFNTIEALAHANFKFVKDIFQADNVRLQVTKFPDIPSLKGGVSFAIEDKCE
ncbi:dihydroneopterin aldolase [Candidatus Bandiella euplotis]|uniref:Dihydroneopterin aldolase n=1 Tax=Candidatus Bandiella euplotis TaxID=1664265 RepID=A0ABZ0UNL2_9RICK|nr:dihydroneopterin aldolase [Candidatus Bandiella woodruffii]WPX97309.1 Dihydroneopterin aldolase [Candidatus Bandiella woodruffii]